MSWKIAAAQLTDIQNDIPAAMAAITDVLEQADKDGIAVICFPECYLQGYTLDKAQTKHRAIDLGSPRWQAILTKLQQYKSTAIIGIIELDAGHYFNTAVVVRSGKVIGKYRKVHLFETNFEAGNTSPVFEVDGLVFGINICYDARFAEGAAALAHKGARVIFYPLNNRLPTDKAIAYRDKHTPNLIARAQETDCWIVSADVTVQDATHTGFGHTAIVQPNGTIACEATHLNMGVVAEVIT